VQGFILPRGSRCFVGRAQFPNVKSSSNDMEEAELDARQQQLRKNAMDLLDCLTSTRDLDSVEYDVEKDMRREEMLQQNDYNQLKIELGRRGLRTAGDKLEMMTRLLLHIIDPTINVNQMSGREANVKFIDEEDLASQKVRRVPEGERSVNIEDGDGPDAEDLMVLKKRVILSSRQSTVGGSSPTSSSAFASEPKKTKVSSKKKTKNVDKEEAEVEEVVGENAPSRILMDGLMRQELLFSTQRVRRSESRARSEDFRKPDPKKNYQQGKVMTPEEANELREVQIKAYVVGGRDVLRSWERDSSVVILLPDSRNAEAGWRSKAIRVLADEISFSIQSIVLVPDIRYTLEEENAANKRMEDNETSRRLNFERVFDDIVAAMHFAKIKYESKSISIAGIGRGAGFALEAACDLSDIASKFYLTKRGQDYLAEVGGKIDDGGANRLNPRPRYDWREDEEGDDEEDSGGELQDLQEELEKGSLFKELNQEFEKSQGADINEEMVMSALERAEAENKEEAKKAAAAKRMIEEQRALKNQKDLEDISANVERADKQGALRVDQGHILASYGSLSIVEVASLVPKSLVAFSPREYDVSKIASCLRLPSFFVLGQDDNEQGSRKQDMLELEKGFMSRVQEMVDFSIRVYEGQVAELDAKCTQEAVAITSLWMDIYSRSQTNAEGKTQFTRGLGQTKYQSPLVVVSKEDMAYKELRASPIATYLHDDPMFCRNSRCDEN